MRSITFARTNRPFAGARYKRIPYSSAKTAQMNRSIAKIVESALGERSMTSGITSSGMIASDRMSIGHAVCRSKRSNASADLAMA